MYKRYASSEEFLALNKETMDMILRGSSLLKSSSSMGALGMPLQEAESLSYQFLNLMNKCTDLLFGLSSSVLNAKASSKKSEAICFIESDGRVKDKEFKAISDETYLKFLKNYNDLDDIKSYLVQKHGDFEKNHYYYKNLSSRD